MGGRDLNCNSDIVGVPTALQAMSLIVRCCDVLMLMRLNALPVTGRFCTTESFSTGNHVIVDRRTKFARTGIAPELLGIHHTAKCGIVMKR